MVERSQEEISLEYFKNFILENQDEIEDYVNKFPEKWLEEAIVESSVESEEQAALDCLKRFVLKNEGQIAEHFKQNPEELIKDTEVTVRVLSCIDSKNQIEQPNLLNFSNRLRQSDLNYEKMKYMQHGLHKFTHNSNEISLVYITAKGINSKLESPEEYLEICIGSIVYIRECPAKHPKASIAIVEEVIEHENIYKIHEYYLITFCVRQDELELTLNSSYELNSTINKFSFKGHSNSKISLNGSQFSDSISLGRAQSCDIIIPNPTISSIHLLISFNGSFIIKDNKSKNKTYRLIHTFSTISNNTISRPFNIQSSEEVLYLGFLYEITKKLKSRY